MSSLATLYAKDLEQTLAGTPAPCLLSAVICGRDWLGLRRLGQGSCVIQEPVHQAADADGGSLTSVETSESESQTRASSKDRRQSAELEGLGNMMSFISLMRKLRLGEAKGFAHIFFH